MALPALSLPVLTPCTHGDDLGIELGWQAGHTGLGTEEAVEGLHGARRHQLERTQHQMGAPRQVAPLHTLCPPAPKRALPGEAQRCCDCALSCSLPLPQQAGQQAPAVPGSSVFASCISRLPAGSRGGLSPSRVQPRGKGAALTTPSVGTLTTWLRVITRSKVSQQVFTKGAGKQGSRSRSRARTCRVVVASLVPAGAEQRLSPWHPMANPRPRQGPCGSARADPQNWGEHFPTPTSGKNRATDRWLRALQNT